MPGATANFSQTLSAVRSAQRILLRAQDGKAATFFVGDRYPVSLALLSSNLSPASTALAAGILAGLLPRTDYTRGNSPVALALADFNGDGIPDLVVANKGNGTTNAGTVSILLGAGDGTFGTATDITIGTSQDTNIPTPSAVAVGNFDGDGNMDIAVTDSANNAVKILRGNGDGTFAAPVTYPTGNTPVALLVKDFNGDGIPDLAVVNQTDGTVSILLGQTGGTFAAKTDYPVGSTPAAIASADFNADGVADLAVTNNSTNTVSILLGNSDGTFGLEDRLHYRRRFPRVSPQRISIVTGNPDLAVANQTDIGQLGFDSSWQWQRHFRHALPISRLGQARGNRGRGFHRRRESGPCRRGPDWKQSEYSGWQWRRNVLYPRVLANRQCAGGRGCGGPERRRDARHRSCE